MQFYIGCSGFYNKDWKAVFYPPKLAQSKWFEYYCTRFNTLELNTTFYRFPTMPLVQKWYERSPLGFRFSVKAPRLITHFKQFNETESLLNDFYATIKEGLKEKLATVLFQLPAKIIYSEEFLQRIIKSVDKTFTNIIEFRDVSWWNEHVFTQLAKQNIVFCGISIKSLPSEIIADSPIVYYRFHGLGKIYFSEYSFQEIQNFAEELKLKAKNKTPYIYFNNTATVAALNNAQQLEKLLVKT